MWLSREQAREVCNVLNAIIVLKLAITQTPALKASNVAVRGTDPWGKAVLRSLTLQYYPLLNYNGKDIDLGQNWNPSFTAYKLVL